MEIRQPTAAQRDEREADRAVPTVAAATLSSLLRGALPTALQARLGEHIRTRRWFRGKARTIRVIEALDHLPLRTAPDEIVVVIIRVSYMSEDSEVYVLPLALATAGDAPASQPPLFDLQSSAGRRVVYDPSSQEDFSQLLLDLFVRERTQGDRGAITATPAAALTILAAHKRPTAQQSKGEQSNTTVFFGDEFMLKLFRQLEAGENPDVELNEFLWAHGYRHVPEPLGSVRYAGEFVGTLGIAQRFVASEGTAWDATLAILQRSFERARTLEPPASTQPTNDLLNEVAADSAGAEIVEPYSAFATRLGRRTAELHLALASDTAAPAFSPEPFTIEYQQRRVRGTRERVDRAFELLARQLAGLAPELKTLAVSVFAVRAELGANLGVLESMPIHASRIRCHGDFHLGQVLYGGGDFTMLDFEGEPAQPLDKRREKGSALYDVCGMLRSFHYAAIVARQDAAWRLEERSALQRWSDAWYRGASAAFLSAYMERARAAGASAVFLPESRNELRALLRLHLIDKCCYEMSYELNNRPAWVGVPMAGLISLAGPS
jgi:maltose alpha-D-glucosyltransferase/alpha-amylase